LFGIDSSRRKGGAFGGMRAGLLCQLKVSTP
jgi:hypothetical protein